jgi:alkanesulfonate monooxygenase SsuD/methylene tetrahydromethanopterin reductase-like flavin-dependent oxidoreductase (luciferase family)
MAQLKFGVFLTPDARRRDDVLAQAIAAEAAGLDLAGIQDHPYQRRFLDTWVLIGHLLARTSRIRVFPAVANLPLRPPAMMAKAAASLDLLSGGRFELGLGAGTFFDAIAGMGGPRLTAGKSVAAVEEAIMILRRAWGTDDALRHEGRHYRLDYKPGPPPAHPIQIWVGAYRPRMLELTGRLADGWIPSLGYLAPDAAADAHRRVDEAAQATGRDPGQVARIYNLSGTITDGGPARGLLDGTAEHWVETLTRFNAELGFDGFLLSPTDPELEQIERFGAEVAPAVRATVTRSPTARP